MNHKQTGFLGKFRCLFLTAVLAFGLIAVIGSGGGDGGGTTPTNGGAIYNTALGNGDLARFEFNPTTRQYTFEVIEGIDEGETDSGTLSHMPGYTRYVYEADGVPVIIFPDTVFIAIPGGGDEGIMVGVPSLSTAYNIDDIAGVYNFVQLAGPGGDVTNYEAGYGTLRVNQDGTWDVLDEGNLAETPAPAPGDSGTWKDQGNGIIHVMRGDTKVANVMVHPSYAGNPDEQVIIANITDGDFTGIMLGVKQQAITSGSVDGTYALLASDKEEIVEVTVTGATVKHPGATLSITYDSPWTGFVEGDDGTRVLMLPGGIFFGVGGGGYDFWVLAGITK